jgi:hypothetical protein
MRYTHYGIGHSTVLRKLIRDCANMDPTDSPGSEESETDSDVEQQSDIQPCHGMCEDEGLDGDSDTEEDEELECDDDDDDEENDLDDEEMEVGEDEEGDYMMSF